MLPGAVQDIAAIGVPAYMSGGITTLDDVRRLSAMKGISAPITGKAIYEGKLDFKEAVKLLR